MHTETSTRSTRTGVRRRTGAAAPAGGVDAGSQEDVIENEEPKTGSSNTRLVFGSVTVKDPSRVVKLCLIVDNHRVNEAWKAWPELENVYVEQLAHLSFDPADIFFSEQAPYPGVPMTSIFRYYTPRENRVHTRA